MKRVERYVGRYVMFDSPVTVYLIEGGDSRTVFNWRRDGYLKMEIGRAPTWPVTVGYAVHEVMETAIMLRRCHYSPYGGLMIPHVDTFLMVMQHPEFTDVTANAGDMLALMLQELAEAWRKMGRVRT